MRDKVLSQAAVNTLNYYSESKVRLAASVELQAGQKHNKTLKYGLLSEYRDTSISLLCLPEATC